MFKWKRRIGQRMEMNWAKNKQWLYHFYNKARTAKESNEPQPATVAPTFCVDPEVVELASAADEDSDEDSEADEDVVFDCEPEEALELVSLAAATSPLVLEPEPEPDADAVELDNPDKVLKIAAMAEDGSTEPVASANSVKSWANSDSVSNGASS